MRTRPPSRAAGGRTGGCPTGRAGQGWWVRWLVGGAVAGWRGEGEGGMSGMSAQEAKLGPLLNAAKQLPYKKWWFWVLLLIAFKVLSTSYENSRPVTYDYQALGFANEEAMNAAFAKGYHTRQKMEEMARFYSEAASDRETNAARH